MLAKGHTWDEACERKPCSRGFVASWTERSEEQRLAGLWVLEGAMLKGGSLRFDVRCNLGAARRTQRVRYDMRPSKPV